VWLGRSTVQWTALISAGGGLAQVLIVTIVPDVDAVLVATLIGSTVAFLGVVIAFLANTQTTPTSDPRLEVGSEVAVLSHGQLTGDKVVVAPTPPGPVGIDATGETRTAGSPTFTGPQG
jgi:hypothetical protein